MGEEVAVLRELALSELERRYGRVTDVRGQGLQRGSRVEFVENGKTVTCTLKVAASGHGRISFPYEGGSWGALSQVERVLYVRPSDERLGKVEIQMHSAQTIMDAFNSNRRAAEKGEFSIKLPVWLSADRESGARCVGSGFGAHALWKAFLHQGAKPISIPATIDARAPNNATSNIGPSITEIIEQAKAELARRLGKNKNEIHIRIDF